MPSKKVALKQHPKLDWAVAILGGEVIPTKQDKFKLLSGYVGKYEENGIETILDELYIRNPSVGKLKEFENKLKEFFKKNISNEQPYKFPSKVEVILVFDIPAKRFFEVDIDNLSKNILDCLKGVVFEDDCQVVNLLALKNIHPYDTNGLMVGINLIDNSEKSWFNKIKLFYFEDVEEK